MPLPFSDSTDQKDEKDLYRYDPYLVDIEAFAQSSVRDNQFWDAVQRLPENIREFLFSDQIPDFIRDRVIKPHNLTIHQGSDLARIIRDILLGDTYLGGIITEIEKRLLVSGDLAKQISALVVRELFAPILDDLKKLHVDKFARPDAVRPAITAQPEIRPPTPPNQSARAPTLPRTQGNVINLRK